jgi:predicted TPR repeat methyltransferase
LSQAEVLQRLIHEGDALLKAGRFAEGEARAREVLAHQPKNAGGQYLLGLSALMQERHGDALAYFDGALRTDRVNPQLHFMAALCQGSLGRTDEAIASYRRALQYQPEFIEARSNLGYLLEHAGRLEEAAESYRRALALAPNEWMTLNRLGYCERLLGRAEQSIEVLKRAAALRPGSAATLNEIALSLLQLERTEEAIASLRAAVAAEPGFAEGWANLAKLLYVRHLEALQESERAGTARPDPAPVVECFDRLLEFDPANAEFKYLRDSIAGARVDRPPDRYIESFFDRFAPRFDARLVEELRYAAPAVAERVLKPRLEGRSGLRVVDLGCGTGLSGGFLRPRAGSLVGVDLSAAMLDRAQARGIYDELVREEIGDYLARREAASLDVAIALDVFIYVGNLERVMGAVAAALAPGGIFAFSIEELAAAGGDFALLPAGRYAHAPAYVTAVAERAGLRAAGSDAFDVRHEAGKPVPARLFLLEKA